MIEGSGYEESWEQREWLCKGPEVDTKVGANEEQEEVDRMWRQKGGAGDEVGGAGGIHLLPSLKDMGRSWDFILRP